MSETGTICPSKIMSLARANNRLAVNLHRLLAEEKGNVFFSPFSISTAMAMLLCAAEGETESEMREALGHDEAGIERDDVASVFDQQMSLLLKNPDSYTLSCANSILSQKDFEVKETYKQMVTESFKAVMLEVDFKNENEKAINQVNEWVKEKTNKMITELVESLDPGTVIVLLNAVYFKGTWLHQFDQESTCPEDFYNKGLQDNAKEVDTMLLAASCPYFEDETMQVLQLPYLGEEVALLILLPREINGLESIEADLTSSLLQDIMGKLEKEEVDLFLPKFRLEYTKSLIPCFQRLGISRVFSSGAELGIASDSNNLAVSEILHKAVLEVNEEGSEAGALPKCAVFLGPSPNPTFIADHPFAFIIYDTRSNLILFMGRVYEL